MPKQQVSSQRKNEVLKNSFDEMHRMYIIFKIKMTLRDWLRNLKISNFFQFMMT